LQKLDNEERLIFWDWLNKAKERKAAEDALDILNFHTDYIAMEGMKKLNSFL